VIKNGLPPSKHLGDLDLSTLDGTWSKPPSTERKPVNLDSDKPPLETLINTLDFEIVASKVLTTKAWAFYSSAATDQITRDANQSMFNRLWFRPRALVDVSQVDTRASMMGCPMELPVFVSPAALARMAHPEGEKELARGVEARSIPQCISTNASFPVEEIVAAVPPNHPFFFQLYVNKNRKVSEALLAKVKSLGVKGLMVTVDAPMPGKREADERAKADENMQSPMTGDRARNDKKGGGLGRVMGKHIDPKFKWDDLEWLRSITDLPIILKGIMSGADAKMAMQHHVDGIVLSNHGGRNLDT
jgi:L-lactate dehydrogenase (cytochrome)